jgi:E1A-binding protein p400
LNANVFLLQLVEYKQQTRLEEKRKKALDQHLSFIVDQTEKYSTWLAESMNKSGVDSVDPSVPASVNSSRISSPIRQVLSDGMLMMCSVLPLTLFCSISCL